jgi:hypothetical protein
MCCQLKRINPVILIADEFLDCNTYFDNLPTSRRSLQYLCYLEQSLYMYGNLAISPSSSD